VPKAGQVRVALNKHAAAETATWLAIVYRPPPSSVVGTAKNRALDLAIAGRLADHLDKVARRRRAHEDFVVPIDRQDAAWLAGLWDAATWLGGAVLLADNDEGYIALPASVRMTLQSFSQALRGRVGRPRLTLGELEQQETCPSRGGDDFGRHQRRIRRDARYERAVRDWLKRGNTILVGQESHPKK
jgi:hypothetical protein